MSSHIRDDNHGTSGRRPVQWSLWPWWVLSIAIGIGTGLAVFGTWQVVLFFGWLGAVVGTVAAAMVSNGTSLWSANKAGTGVTGGAIVGVGIGALIGTITGAVFGAFWIVSFVVSVVLIGPDSFFSGEFTILGTVLLVMFVGFVMLPFVGALTGAASGAVSGAITGAALALWPR